MRVDVLTLFPNAFQGYLNQSVLRRAIERKSIEVCLHNIRDWSTKKHLNVDDRPFGGGAGMILMVEPIVDCVESVQHMAQDQGHLVLLSPHGRRLTQSVAEELVHQPRLLLLCGRYEGFDQRVVDVLGPDEISVGDFVLSGGEVAAMVVLDTVTRLVPGVLGDDRSNVEESFSPPQRLLEYAQYTRPREYRGHQVPEVLLSGNHAKIARWRMQQSLKQTKRLHNRPLVKKDS